MTAAEPTPEPTPQPAAGQAGRTPHVPLDKMQMWPYMMELIHEANSASAAARRWNEFTERGRRAAAAGRTNSGAERPTVSEWFSIAQGILSAAAMYSKVLWPNPTPDMDEESREFMMRRGKSLRRALKVKSNQALQSRAVRNSFEHFDERLDSFVRDKTKPSMVDLNVSSPGAIVIEGFDVAYMRQIDLSSMNVSVLGDTVSMKELVESMHAIATRAGEWVAESDEADRQQARRETPVVWPTSATPFVRPEQPAQPRLNRAERRRQNRANGK